MSRELCDGFWVDDYERGGGKVLALTGPWRPAIADEIERRDVYVLRLSASNGWVGADVSFLSELPGLRGLEIYGSTLRDVSPIECLRGLEFIGLECDFRSALDFTVFPKLKSCFLTWKSGAESLLECPGLEHLNVSNYPYPDLSQLSCRARLTRLQLTGRKISSLLGIEQCVRLDVLDLFDCPNLASLRGVEQVPSLRDIEIEQCKSVSSVEPIGYLSSLVSLVLNDCGNIESLDPLRRCQNLERLCFTGTTVIADGDLSVLESLPKLQAIRFADRRSYSMKLQHAQSMVGMQ